MKFSKNGDGNSVYIRTFIWFSSQFIWKIDDLYYRKKLRNEKKEDILRGMSSQSVEKPSCGSNRNWVSNQYSGKT